MMWLGNFGLLILGFWSNLHLNGLGVAYFGTKWRTGEAYKREGNNPYTDNRVLLRLFVRECPSHSASDQNRMVYYFVNMVSELQDMADCYFKHGIQAGSISDGCSLESLGTPWSPHIPHNVCSSNM